MGPSFGHFAVLRHEALVLVPEVAKFEIRCNRNMTLTYKMTMQAGREAIEIVFK